MYDNLTTEQLADLHVHLCEAAKHLFDAWKELRPVHMAASDHLVVLRKPVSDESHSVYTEYVARREAENAVEVPASRNLRAGL
jgi:hypothetical protein